jgi:hypothetical protein
MAKRKTLATFLHRFKKHGTPIELKEMYDGNLHNVSDSYHMGTLREKTLREGLELFKSFNRSTLPGGSSIISRRMGPLKINGRDCDSGDEEETDDCEDDDDDDDDGYRNRSLKRQRRTKSTSNDTVMLEILEVVKSLKGSVSTLDRSIRAEGGTKAGKQCSAPSTLKTTGLLYAPQARMITATNIPRSVYGNGALTDAQIIGKREQGIQLLNQMSTIGPMIQPLIRKFNAARDTMALAESGEERYRLEEERTECVMKMVKLALMEMDRIFSLTIKKPGKDGGGGNSGGKGLIFQTGGGLRKISFGPLVVKTNSPCTEDVILSREETVILDSVTVYPWTPFTPSAMPFLGPHESLAEMAVCDRMINQSEKSADLLKAESLQRIKSTIIETINAQITYGLGHIEEIILPYFLQRLDSFTNGSTPEPNAGCLLLFVDVAQIKTMLDNPLWQPRYKRFPRMCPNRGIINSGVLQVAINGPSKHSIFTKHVLHAFPHIFATIHPSSRNVNVTDHTNPVYKFFQDICEMDELLD